MTNTDDHEAVKNAMRPLIADAITLLQMVRTAPDDEVGALVPAIEYTLRLDLDRARTAAAILAILVVGMEKEAEAKAPKARRNTRVYNDPPLPDGPTIEDTLRRRVVDELRRPSVIFPPEPCLAVQELREFLEDRMASAQRVITETEDEETEMYACVRYVAFDQVRRKFCP